MIYAIYTYPNNGLEYEQKEISNLLKPHKRYEVKHIDMGMCFTSVYLDGFERPFNSVFFSFFEDDRLLDIFKDSRFNPFLKPISLKDSF